MVAAARIQLRRVAATVVPRELPEKIVVRVGISFDEIVNTARDLRVDWLAITTHGYAGITRAWLGSTAERVVRHTHCPVLTI